MDIRKHRGLIALNAVLLVALAVVTLSPGARAQQGGRARGDYTMVGGRVQGGIANAVYIIDSANREMIALQWDEARKELLGVGYRDLAADGKARPGR